MQMEINTRQRARQRLVAAMLAGQSWQELARAEVLPLKRAMAYRLVQAVRTRGEVALADGRHGHPSKLRGEARAFLEELCRQAPTTPSSTLQVELRERFEPPREHQPDQPRSSGTGGKLSPTEPGTGKKTGVKEIPSPQPEWQEGAGGFLLLAAAHQTGLLTAFQTALYPCLLPAAPALRLTRAQPAILRSQMLTLLFLQAVGLRRSWDLRGYTGQALALLTSRHRAYGYRHTVRFLAELASLGADAPLTEALARWTASLWEKAPQKAENPVPVFYVDGHRKPVYADALIPRGLIGRTGKVLGCRALVVLHDREGHPLLITTHRGDQHLTLGLPAILAHYKQAAEMAHLKRIVVDREGMAAEFLAALANEGRTVVTVLRTDQYTSMQSFREVGEFLPLQADRQGKVIREMALARFGLPLRCRTLDKSCKCEWR